MSCGTPVITTDWGAFTETVQQGKTGFRCNTLAEFVQAAQDAEALDRNAIREYAISRYSTDVVRHQYDAYFKRLATLQGKGWYAD
jgi:glycosyltransferase involved in cell wall biosynthesis